MDTNTQVRTFQIRNSEKCYRFKDEAIVNHAPPNRGIYELVTFDANQNPRVLYVGAAFDKTIQQCLEGHQNGTLEPKAHELLATHENLYFDFLAEMNAKSVDDAQDIYWWLIQKHNPLYNDVPNVLPSARPGDVVVVELE